MTNNQEAMILVFVNHNKEDEIYPLIAKELGESQNRDPDPKQKLKSKIFCSAGQTIVL